VFRRAKDMHDRECGICFDEKISFVACDRCNNEWCAGCTVSIHRCPFCRYNSPAARAPTNYEQLIQVVDHVSGPDSSMDSMDSDSDFTDSDSDAQREIDYPSSDEQ
jgi:hypothetical protein